MKVAIVYDRVNKYGGAERLLESIISIFPDAPLFTLVYEPKNAKWTKKTKVTPTFLNKFFFLRSHHEILAPVAPMAFETLDLKAFDLVISVTSSDAKSILTSPHQIHLCICLTPTRYLWKGSKSYQQDWKMKFLPTFMFNYFRFVDQITALRPDYFLAISNEVRRRIKNYYNRESIVIYPPVSKLFFKKNKKHQKKDFYLVAGRLVPYKKVDLVINYFNKSNKKLVVIGEGSEFSKLKKMASKNITFLGKVSDRDLIKYYSQSKALIFPGLEDFGLIPLEVQAVGTPVIAYKAGGAKETIIDGVTGVFFKKQTVKSLSKAIEKFEKLRINPNDCIRNAKRFNIKEFKTKLLEFVVSIT